MAVAGLGTMVPGKGADDCTALLGTIDASKLLCCTQTGIAVVNKPASVRINGDFPLTLNTLMQLPEAGLGAFSRPCHQLDAGTSGCMATASSSIASAAVSTLFEHRMTSKTYIAVVHGHIDMTCKAERLDTSSVPYKLAVMGNAASVEPAKDCITPLQVAFEQPRSWPQRVEASLDSCSDAMDAEDAQDGILPPLEQLVRSDVASLAIDPDSPLPSMLIRANVAIPSQEDFRMSLGWCSSSLGGVASYDCAGHRRLLDADPACKPDTVTPGAVTAIASASAATDTVTPGAATAIASASAATDTVTPGAGTVSGKSLVWVPSLASANTAAHDHASAASASSASDSECLSLPMASGRSGCTRVVLLRTGVTPNGEPVSLLALSPLTGRRHQLRVHLAAIGHPVYGDLTYGCKSTHAKRLCLHAWRLVLPLHAAGPLKRRYKTVRRLAAKTARNRRPDRIKQMQKSSAAASGGSADSGSATLATEDASAPAKRTKLASDVAAVHEMLPGCWIGSREAARAQLGNVVVEELEMPCAPMVVTAPSDIMQLVQ